MVDNYDNQGSIWNLILNITDNFFIKTRMKKELISLLVISYLLIFPMAAMAQGIDVGEIFNRFTNFILWPIFIGLVVIMITWAGILYLTARGEPGKIQTANKVLIWGVVGVAVGILAYSAYKIVYWFVFGVYP